MNPRHPHGVPSLVIASLSRRTRTVVAAVLLATAPILAPADDAALRAQGRTVVAERGGAIVTLRLVHTVSMAWSGREGQTRERRGEALATVIGADGLTIAPLSEVDPASTYRRMYGNRMGENEKFETKLKDARIILGDNREVPATVVLRDADLDLAFLRPIEKPTEPMAHIELNKDAQPELLSPVFTVGRLPKLAQRQLAARTGEISSVVSRPRTFYVPSDGLIGAGLGAPAFLSDGTAFGIVLSRTQPGGGDDDDGPMAIILPALDILEVAAQAPEKPASDAQESTADGDAPAAPSEPAAPETPAGE